MSENLGPLPESVGEPCITVDGRLYRASDIRALASADKEAELHRARIEEMAGERHLLHSSVGKEDRFWGCSRGPCKAAAEYLRGNRPWYCGARHAGTAGGNDPQDCDWPFCGCDPAANRVLEAVEESGRFVEAPHA